MYTRISHFAKWIQQQVPAAVIHNDGVAATVAPVPNAVPTAKPTMKRTAKSVAKPTTKPAAKPTLGPFMTPTAQSPAKPRGSPGSALVYFINCGGGATGAWAADQYYSVGSLAWGPPTASKPVVNRQRYAPSGKLSYTLPLHEKGRAYRIKVYWAELHFNAPGKRVMDVAVAADGRAATAAFSGIDVLKSVGRQGRVLSRTYPPPSSPPLAADDTIVVSVAGVRGEPFLTALQVVDGGPAPALPNAGASAAAAPWSTAFNCGGGALTGDGAVDGDGGVAYAPDGAWSTPSSAWGSPRADLPPVLRSQRYAPVGVPLTYTLRVPRAGRYALRAAFVELYHTAPAQRLLSVHVGGDGDGDDGGGGDGDGEARLTRLARGIDVWAAAVNASTPVVIATRTGGEVTASHTVVVRVTASRGGAMVSSLRLTRVKPE